jgi:ABC-type transport system involved in cytochrome bd biosynthesis fused ATPase/permease subunit
VGRTGAGECQKCLRFFFTELIGSLRQKLITSSIIPVSLFRIRASASSDSLSSIVELHSGKIEVDGRDISNVKLDALRSSLALVPQDTTLFLGTLRENL